MDSTQTDGELVQAVRDGDETAFATLFERWADRCNDVARRILGDEGQAAEATQEVFTMAWQQIDSLRDADAFGGWVLRSARNRALNRLRHERRSVATETEDPVLRDLAGSSAVDVEAAALDNQELVWAAAAALGERDASVLDLHLRHDLSVPEIAEELGVTPNNAHQMLFRMKQRLALSIRAYVLVRGGDARCPELRASLAEAGVTRFGPEAVKVIGAHAGQCDECDGRQASVLAPEALFASAPLLVLAPAARAQVISGLREAGAPIGSGPSPAGASGGQSAGADGSAGGGQSASRGGGSSTRADGSGAGPDGAAGLGAAAPTPVGGRSRSRSRGRVVGALAAVAVVVAVVLGVVFLTGDDGGSEPQAGGTVATSAPDGRGGGADRSVVTGPSTTAPEVDEIEGSWVADASDILAANTANVGGPGDLSCTGPITMTFAPDGTYSRSGQVTCQSGSLSASGAVATSGRYTAEDGQLVVSSTAATGTMTLGVAEIPTPDAFGDGRATYEVEGGALQITFDDVSVGTVSQTYARA